MEVFMKRNISISKSAMMFLQTFSSLALIDQKNKIWFFWYLYIWYHPIKIQTNSFWIIVSVFRPRNSSIIENILVITCKDYFETIRNLHPCDRLPNKFKRQNKPQVGDDIRTFAPGKYRSISAAASRSEPVPERPWTVATSTRKKKKRETI